MEPQGGRAAIIGSVSPRTDTAALPWSARLCVVVDRVRATRDQREEAKQRAVDAHFRFGSHGAAHLIATLAAERSAPRRRILRLAIARLSRKRGSIPQ